MLEGRGGGWAVRVRAGRGGRRYARSVDRRYEPQAQTGARTTPTSVLIVRI